MPRQLARGKALLGCEHPVCSCRATHKHCSSPLIHTTQTARERSITIIRGQSVRDLGTVRLERASEGLIPRLRGSDAAHEILTVAHVEIKLGEELLLG